MPLRRPSSITGKIGHMPVDKAPHLAGAPQPLEAGSGGLRTRRLHSGGEIDGYEAKLGRDVDRRKADLRAERQAEMRQYLRRQAEEEARRPPMEPRQRSQMVLATPTARAPPSPAVSMPDQPLPPHLVDEGVDAADFGPADYEFKTRIERQRIQEKERAEALRKHAAEQKKQAYARELEQQMQEAKMRKERERLEERQRNIQQLRDNVLYDPFSRDDQTDTIDRAHRAAVAASAAAALEPQAYHANVPGQASHGSIHQQQAPVMQSGAYYAPAPQIPPTVLATAAGMAPQPQYVVPSIHPAVQAVQALQPPLVAQQIPMQPLQMQQPPQPAQPQPPQQLDLSTGSQPPVAGAGAGAGPGGRLYNQHQVSQMAANMMPAVGSPNRANKQQQYMRDLEEQIREKELRKAKEKAEEDARVAKEALEWEKMMHKADNDAHNQAHPHHKPKLGETDFGRTKPRDRPVGFGKGGVVIPRQLPPGHSDDPFGETGEHKVQGHKRNLLMSAQRGSRGGDGPPFPIDSPPLGRRRPVQREEPDSPASSPSPVPHSKLEIERLARENEQLRKQFQTEMAQMQRDLEAKLKAEREAIEAAVLREKQEAEDKSKEKEKEPMRIVIENKNSALGESLQSVKSPSQMREAVLARESALRLEKERRLMAQKLAEQEELVTDLQFQTEMTKLESETAQDELRQIRQNIRDRQYRSRIKEREEKRAIAMKSRAEAVLDDILRARPGGGVSPKPSPKQRVPVVATPKSSAVADVSKRRTLREIKAGRRKSAQLDAPRPKKEPVPEPEMEPIPAYDDDTPMTDTTAMDPLDPLARDTAVVRAVDAVWRARPETAGGGDGQEAGDEEPMATDCALGGESRLVFPDGTTSAIDVQPPTFEKKPKGRPRAVLRGRPPAVPETVPEAPADGGEGGELPGNNAEVQYGRRAGTASRPGTADPSADTLYNRNMHRLQYLEKAEAAKEDPLDALDNFLTKHKYPEKKPKIPIKAEVLGKAPLEESLPGESRFLTDDL